MSIFFSSRLRRNAGLDCVWCSVLGIVALAVLLTFSSRTATAQVLFGSVVGSVTDASGASVPGAAVRITEVSTNDSRTVQTNEAGAYTVSTVPAGTYRVEIGKEGFRGFATSNILVNQNNVVRVDAQLQVGGQAEKVEVTAQSAALQTDRADVHSEVATQALENLPQANRSYEGLLALVPGMSPPGGQLAGGTNNPSKSMQFGANGTGVNGANVRIEGVSATNPWSIANTTFVPSVEAIANVNVVTNSPDAEQGQAGGASVNVMLKGGSNQTHGAAFGYNIVSAFEANNFFAPAGSETSSPGGQRHGRLAGRPHRSRTSCSTLAVMKAILHDRRIRESFPSPTQQQLHGRYYRRHPPQFTIHTAVPPAERIGSRQTPFPGNIIPQSRFSPVVAKIIPFFPVTNLPGVVNNNYINEATVYNLHKIDTKVDYNATSKLRLSGRWGYQPYYNSAGAGLRYHSGRCKPFLDGCPARKLPATRRHPGQVRLGNVRGESDVCRRRDLWRHAGVTSCCFPNRSNVRYGSDVLGIPGTNLGQSPVGWRRAEFQHQPTSLTMGASYHAS